MPGTAFSFSAPQFTEDDELKEIEDLTEAERTDIRNDLMGTNTALHETLELRQDGIVELQDELDCISGEEKTAYLQALEECPAVVQRETSPLLFLRSTKFNAKLAARRLVEYWKWRLTIFGPEKAFLPMTLQDALRDDREVLEKGWVQVLDDDDHDRAVIYFEKGRINPMVSSRNSLLRVVWYVHHIVLQKEAAQRNGIVHVLNMKGYTLKHFDRIGEKYTRVSVLDCLPIRWCALHFPSPSVEKDTVVYELLVPVWKHIVGKQMRTRIALYDEASDLERFGINPESLPESMGGQRSHQEYGTWLEERRYKELVIMMNERGNNILN
mmetsp:Transcript_18583/g.28697  ORF Transcript_18583/g.28697 Transcript_18583/m.28697 type:complete len:326 (+) Transcript_18583:85-1062(+)|eukprot:CAMPEP_0195284346 /NCGR_PEP_ID=MMETSP0707-20130614/2578_1 /TAXON_ID=33640 /ORGANISM="Asterionellopsis glacialis, Strain CCMP134" /LENGTH=325 /DNA_ID=CAMNT_0040343673 /DNA_START=73 /DNA_END=1050 /DNA_ORIENTATION=+